jgi:hypothetical protein
MVEFNRGEVISLDLPDRGQRYGLVKGINSKDDMVFVELGDTSIGVSVSGWHRKVVRKLNGDEDESQSYGEIYERNLALKPGEADHRLSKDLDIQRMRMEIE